MSDQPEKALSPRIQDLAARVDLRDPNSIVRFGQEAQGRAASAADAMLGAARNDASGQAGDALSGLLSTLRGFDAGAGAEKPGLVSRLFGRVSTGAVAILQKYETVRGQVEAAGDRLQAHRTQLLEDVERLERLYDTTLDWFRALAEHIEAGEVVLARADAESMPEAEWAAEVGRDPLPMMPPALFGAAIEEAHKLGLKAAAHIHSLEQARAVVAAGVDVVAHGVRDQPVDEALIREMRMRGTWYIATIALDDGNVVYAERPELLDDPFVRAALNPALLALFADPAWRARQLAAAQPSRDAVAMNKRNLRTLHEAGVRIGFGTDSGATHLRVPGFAEHRELELMVEAGLTPEQALVCATGGAAALLGLEDRGLLRAGRRADLVVLEGDPLADIRNSRRIRAVWQRGREVAGAVA